MATEATSNRPRAKSWRRPFLAAAAAGAVLSAAPAVSDYVRSRPFDVVQPDGTRLRLLVTGDEHYRWVHDEKGRVILRDKETGLATYAIKVDGNVVPGALLVGVDDPDALGLESNLMPDPGRFPVSPYAAEPSTPRGRSVLGAGKPSFTKINNLVIFVRFAKEAEFPSTRKIGVYRDDFFNGTDPKTTLRSYFLEASYKKTTIDSTFYPKPEDDGRVVSYQDSHERGYFRPYDEKTNPDGYKDDEALKDREWNLVASAVTYVASEVPADLDIDTDRDGNVDSIVLVVNGGADAWMSLLWPHKWQLNKPVVYINKKRVYKYNFEPDSGPNGLSVGTLCHELFHTLGAPDLYHYPNCRMALPDIDPVSTWDLMNTSSPPAAEGAPANPPVHMGAHMKWRYGGFVDSIPEITASGRYTLSPLTSSTGMAYQIASPYSGDESFVVEYRRKTGLFEKGIPNQGLLVTRIDRRQQGNDCGPPDEVYVFRPGGTPALAGEIGKAPLSKGSGRTAIGETTDPVPFLQDGSSGGLSIGEVGEAGDTISFDVRIETLPCTGSINLTSPPDGSQVVGTKVDLSWAPAGRAASYDVYVGTTIDLMEPSNVTTSSLPDKDVEPGKTYFWKVVARGAGACSRSSAVQTFRTSTIAKLTKGVRAAVPDGAQGSFQFFSVDVPLGVKDLAITTTGGTGNLDLYVRYGQPPRSTVDPLECKSEKDGNEEECVLKSPWVGTTYILVYGYEAHRGSSLAATWSGGEVTATPLEKGGRVTIADSVARNVKVFSVAVPFGASNLSFTTSGGTGTADLTSRYQAVPMTGFGGFNACSSKPPGAAGVCSVEAPYQGTYYLAVEATEPYAGVELVADWASATDPFTCTPNETTMCLGVGGRFRVQADYGDHSRNTGPARVKKLTDLSGALYFSDPSSVELVAKFVSFCNGTAPNWSIYVAGLTDAAFLLKVTDTATGRYWERQNALGNRICTIGDGPFACPAGLVTDAGDGSLLRDEANRKALALLAGLGGGPAPETRVDTPAAISFTATGSPSACTPGATTMCLGPEGRFQVQADYKDYDGNVGQGKVHKLTDLSGYLTFSDSSSVELVAKFVSFCSGEAPNWSIYASGLTDLEVTFKVTDTKTGLSREYRNELGSRFCMIGDGAFTCP